MNNFIGGSTSQRRASNVFCRKSGAMVPNPVYNYECWQSSSTGLDAQNSYNSIPTTAYFVNVGNIVGSGTYEKVNTERTILCEKVTGSFPGAVSSYYCHSRM